MRDRVRRWGWMWSVLLIALAARVAHWLVMTPDYVTASDADHYRQIATNIADGEGFSIMFPTFSQHQTAFRPPLYPYLLGGTFKVFGSELVVGRILSLVLGVAAIAVAMLLVARIAPRRAAVAAGLALALYPPLIANDTMLLTEPLSMLLLVGMFLSLVPRRWVIAAVLCGLLALTRTSAPLLIVVVGAWLWWQIGWRRALGFAGIALLVMSPWVIRNWVVLGSPVLTTSTGFNAAAIYSEQARVSGGFVDPAIDDAFREYRLLKYDEAKWSSKLQQLARDSLAEHPTQVFPVIGRNAMTWFELDPGENEFAELLDGRSLGFRNWTLPLFYVVTIVGWTGLLLRRREPMVVLLIATSLYFTATALLFVAPPRLRAPFDLICCLGVGLAIDAFLARRERQARDEHESQTERASTTPPLSSR